AAHNAGIAENFPGVAHTLSEDGQGGPPNNGVVLGQYQTRVLDMASAYATLAASGTYRKPHFIQKVVNADGQVLFDAGSSDNTGEKRISDDTGTAQLGDTKDNKDAWMVGFTPSLSTAVWVGTDDGKPIKTSWGGPIYGSGLPSDIWKKTMDGALEGTTKETFPKPGPIGGYAGVPTYVPPPPVPNGPPVPAPAGGGEVTVIQPTIEIAPGITIPVGPPTTVPDERRVADELERATVSPEELADDLRSADDRDFPSRTDAMGAELSEVVGGPLGRHALAGRQPFWTPLRVVFIIALGFLILGWTSKAPCLQQSGTGNGAARVANWDNNRAYYELCYSDTVPLYGAELLNQGRFPYKSSWLETDSGGHQKIQYDGTPAVRYMEYPVVTGVYQYTAMALAKTYTQASDLLGLPIVAEVVMFFDIVAFGLALAWLVTIWASAGLSPRTRPWDVVMIAAMTALWAWARKKPWLAGVLMGLGVAAKLYPMLLLLPLLLVSLRSGKMHEFAKTAAAAAATWVVVNAPVAMLFP
ncbi:Penicillin-binding protein 1A, partial [Aduncisulcus paluster]